MALQGNLRDFSAMEILQLVGSQKKSGCLVMDWNTERALVWVTDGRIVATRPPGLTKDDPLARFLRQTNRLSEEQLRGLVTIQKESHRDFEDLLVNGRYIEREDLAGLVERQVLDDLSRLVRWESGTYRFDPSVKWPNEPLIQLSMEGALIEAARRVDEQKRFMASFRDPHQLLSVHDLPDPDEELSDEERELFGIIDGHRTVAEVVIAAPLCEFEAYESLHRMLESKWITVSGRRAPGQPLPSAVIAPPPPRSQSGAAWPREIAVAVLVAGAVALAVMMSGAVRGFTKRDVADDVYAASRARDLRFAVELFERERGEYPRRLEDLTDDRWIEPAELFVPGYAVEYKVRERGTKYELKLTPDR
jgi:hypothetical protein